MPSRGKARSGYIGYGEVSIRAHSLLENALICGELMSVYLDIAPNNILPSAVEGQVVTPKSMLWFDGCLSVNFEGVEINASVLLDFGLDTYTMFSVVSQNGYVQENYVQFGYVSGYTVGD